MRVHLPVLGFGVALLLAGCGGSASSCRVMADCPTGQACVAGRCVAPDAGSGGGAGGGGGGATGGGGGATGGGGGATGGGMGGGGATGGGGGATGGGMGGGGATGGGMGGGGATGGGMGGGGATGGGMGGGGATGGGMGGGGATGGGMGGGGATGGGMGGGGATGGGMGGGGATGGGMGGGGATGGGMGGGGATGGGMGGGGGGGLLMNGTSCTSPSQCQSNQCTDGVCCSTACTGTCESCAVTGSVGTCTAIPDGMDPDSECAQSAASTCGLDGFCSGNRSCRRYAAGTVCSAASCASSTVSNRADTCDGNGTCVDSGTQACVAYTCNTSTGTCRTSCGAPADCQMGFGCGGGVCVGAPSVTAASPDFGSVEGGTVVTVTGTNLQNATATLGGAAVTVSVNMAGTSLTFTTPAHAAGAADLVITTAGGSATRSNAFTWVLRLKAPRTITPDGPRTEWSNDYLVGSSSTASNWTAANQMTALRVAYDSSDLFIAIDGEVETGNALVVYLDRDFGAATGVPNLTVLTDGAGALDDACSGGLDASGVVGFGAEFCAGTKGLASVSIGAAFPATDSAGLRDVATNPGDFSWATDSMGNSLVAVGTTRMGTPGAELRIPWTSIYPGGFPATATTLGLFVRITNGAGTGHAGQSLPLDNDAMPQTVSQVGRVLLR